MLGKECFGFRNELCLSVKDTNLPERFGDSSDEQEAESLGHCVYP